MSILPNEGLDTGSSGEDRRTTERNQIFPLYQKLKVEYL